MNEKLQFIREKCIAANPHRAEGWDWDSGRPEGSGYMDHAPCRLADVLRAVPNETKRLLLYGYLSGDRLNVWEARIMNVLSQWDTRADDLEKQSEDTINFLYELLN
jgi:hypothetical protein